MEIEKHTSFFTICLNVIKLNSYFIFIVYLIFALTVYSC